MERRYRESVLKKRKQHIKLLAGGLALGIMGHFLAGTPSDVWKSFLQKGADCVVPAIFKYQEEDAEREEAPFLLRWLVPQVFAYTWKEDIPAFAIIEVVKEEK